jgi:hypothetical protein
MLLDWLRGAFRSGLTAAGLTLFTVAPLLGQASTGKIQGRVTDAATGAPIAGGQVTVDESTLGNLTNDQGFYFINEVPAGLQSARAQFIGYRTLVIEDERILAGFTTTLNFELEATAVELEAITVEGERNPLVPRDQVGSKSIVQGEAIDQLPLDNAASIIQFAPGVITAADGEITIRGGRPNEEAVFIDGVLVRAFGTALAMNVNVPTNALEQVDIVVGAFSAEFGEAQGGVVSFVTRRGGPRYTGSLEAMTDQLAPNSYRTNFNRLEGSVGGPIYGQLGFFLAGTAQGQDEFINDQSPERFVINGIDTCPGDPQFAGLCEAGQPAVFAVPRTSTADGGQDFVDMAAPAFVPWANGRTTPFNFRDQYLLTGNLNYQLPRGSRINLAYTRNRDQDYGRGGGVVNLYNVERADGDLAIRNVVTLGTYLALIQTPEQQLALDLRASYQTDRRWEGLLDPQWSLDNRNPFLGFSFSSQDFLVDEDQYKVVGLNPFQPSDEFINAVRSGAIPAEEFQVFGSRDDLSNAQALAGVQDNVRFNPYGWRTGFDFVGIGNEALRVTHEDRLQLRGTVDWQIGRFNRVKAGAEYQDFDLWSSVIPAFDRTVLPERAKPIRAGAFFQDRFDIGDLVLEAGVRWDYLDPKVSYPRTPGFVNNVPDSLKAGFVRLDTEGNLVPLNACGPESADPSAPCKSNFIEGETKSEWSPRMGVSFPVTPTSTFRLSYGRFVQTPAFFTAVGTFGLGATGTAAAQTGSFLNNTNNDLRSGNSNTNTEFARDVNLPSTRAFEFGYRQLIGQDLVVDIAAFNKKQRAGLTYRRLPFEDPTNPGQIFFLNVAANDDFVETNGFEVKVDKAIGNLFQGSLAYSFLDAKGTGSDPQAFVDLILRNVSNISAITGEPDNPPKVLLPLEQSRRHSIGVGFSLLFPADFMEGTVVGAIFQEFGVFATGSFRSGLPFTKLNNIGEGQTGPPSRGGLSGRPVTSLGALQTGWSKTFDVRITKAFEAAGVNWQLFADWRNPFDFTNTETVFLETGNPINELHREKFLADALGDPRLDGDGEIDDFDIAAESPETDFNTYMLLRAEQRWGDGDGIFTEEEQRTAFGQRYDVAFDVPQFSISNQVLRLGLRVSF